MLSGIVTTSIGGRWDMGMAALVVGTENDIVVAGLAHVDGDQDFVALHYDSDGALDTDFGEGGVVTTPISRLYNDAANAAVADADGKIVLAGTVTVGRFQGNDLALTRHNADGTVDNTFGKKGVVQTDLGGNERLNGATIQSDGKIVVTGSSDVSGAFRFTTARYTSTGQLDTSFGGDGVVETSLGERWDEANAIAMHQGKILVIGVAESGDVGGDFALVRYNLDGSLDDSFGEGDGIVISDFFGHGARPEAFVVDSSNKIVVVGEVAVAPGTYDLAVARYTSDGTLDDMFGNDGLVLTNVFGYEKGTAVAIQPADGKADDKADDKIVVGGFAYLADEPDGVAAFALARYDSEGNLDASFGSDGTVVTLILDYAKVESVAIQSDGKIVVTGWAEGDSGRVIVLARYTADGLLDTTFGPSVNSPPVAVYDTGSTGEDTAVPISVLANDFDAEGDTLQVDSVTQGDNGSVNSDGTVVTYTPNANFNGTDTFTYTISDGNGGTDTATVMVTVDPVADPLEAVGDTASTTPDTAVVIDVLANDSDPDGDVISVISVTPGANGTVTDSGDGTVTYTPNTSFTGTDSFDYTVSDGDPTTADATATVNVTVQAVSSTRCSPSNTRNRLRTRPTTSRSRPRPPWTKPLSISTWTRWTTNCWRISPWRSFDNVTTCEQSQSRRVHHDRRLSSSAVSPNSPQSCTTGPAARKGSGKATGDLSTHQALSLHFPPESDLRQLRALLGHLDGFNSVQSGFPIRRPGHRTSSRENKSRPVSPCCQGSHSPAWHWPAKNLALCYFKVLPVFVAPEDLATAESADGGFTTRITRPTDGTSDRSRGDVAFHRHNRRDFPANDANSANKMMSVSFAPIRAIRGHKMDD